MVNLKLFWEDLGNFVCWVVSDVTGAGTSGRIMILMSQLLDRNTLNSLLLQDNVLFVIRKTACPLPNLAMGQAINLVRVSPPNHDIQNKMWMEILGGACN